MRPTHDQREVFVCIRAFASFQCHEMPMPAQGDAKVIGFGRLVCNVCLLSSIMLFVGGRAGDPVSLKKLRALELNSIIVFFDM